MPSSSFDLSAWVAQLGRFVLRLGFWLIAAVALMSLLVVSLGLLMLGLLRALITGKRPQPMMKFNFQNFKTGQGARFWPGEEAGASNANEPLSSARGPRRRIGADTGPVVDVEVREVPDPPRN